MRYLNIIMQRLILLTIVGLTIYIFKSYPYQQTKTPKPSVSSLKPSVATPSLTEEERNVPSVLLIDSILSIVQSYYVDPERVSNEKILSQSLKALEEEGLMTKREGTRLQVWTKKTEKNFYIPNQLDYNGLLATLVEISRMIDIQMGLDHPKKKKNIEPQGTLQVLRALLGTLDAHSSLLSQEAYRELRQGTEGAFGGLGVLVGIRDQILTVLKPLPRSPAFRQGLRRNDRILSIDGVDTFGYSLNELVEYMRGDPGTLVDISLLREGALSSENLILKREIIHVDSVTEKIIDNPHGKVLHLIIESFSSRTSREVLSSIVKFRKNNNGKIGGLILDLRSNPGGLLDQAVQVADLFLKHGVIVSTKGRREEVEVAGKGYDEVDYPMAILLNEDSASASEILAGALQDHDRAIVIGQKSFGKGSVQTIFELPGERALKLTIARYYTPLGRSIQNVGITPDVWIQPIYDRKANKNLLGPNRYRNERFLRNHLLTDFNNELSTPKEKFKAYYYSGLSNESLSDIDLEREFDQELEIAKIVIEKVMKTYESGLPTGARRSSHWIALSSPEIHSMLQGWNAKVETFLTDRFSIRWQKQELNGATNLRIESELEEIDEIYPGDKIQIPFTIANLSDVPAERVSVFLRSPNTYFETKEVLIGRVPANDFYRGYFEYQIPPYMPAGDYFVDLSLAVESQALDSPPARVDLSTLDKINPNLSVVASLVDEKGGKVDGILEALEKAKVKLEIINNSAIRAREVAIRLINLAGLQIRVKKEASVVKELKPWEKKTIYVGIEASKSIINEILALGVSIESNDLAFPVKEKKTFKGLPTRIAADAKSLGH